jgi:hypothetical protein
VNGANVMSIFASMTLLCGNHEPGELMLHPIQNSSHMLVIYLSRDSHTHTHTHTNKWKKKYKNWPISKYFIFKIQTILK